MGGNKILPVPCPPLIEVALYHIILNDSNLNSETMDWYNFKFESMQNSIGGEMENFSKINKRGPRLF